MENKLKQTAADMAKEIGLINITRDALCERAGIAPGSFRHISGQTFTEFIDDLAGEIMDDPLVAAANKKKRASEKLRKRQILAAGIELANEVGVENVLLSEVADRAGITRTWVHSFFNTKQQLTRAIKRQMNV